MILGQHSVRSDWQFNTQLRVLQADWLISENNEKATLNINMPYYYVHVRMLTELVENCVSAFDFFIPFGFPVVPDE
mgnify:FL=1